MLNEQFFSTVLLVDDEPLVLQQLGEVVRALGYLDVRHVSTVAEAMEVLDKNRVCILVADIGLPDGDGRRLAMEALRLNPDLLLVLISGFPAQALLLSQELRERAHLLEKPFDFHDLTSLLTGCTCAGETHGSNWRR